MFVHEIHMIKKFIMYFLKKDIKLISVILISYEVINEIYRFKTKFFPGIAKSIKRNTGSFHITDPELYSFYNQKQYT